jgi:hypothetical protein
MRRLLMQPPIDENVSLSRPRVFSSHIRRLLVQPPIAEKPALG